MIAEVLTYFTHLEMIEHYQKTCSWNSKSSKTKDYVRNYGEYTKLKITSSDLRWDIWLLWEYQNKILIYNLY